MGRDDSQCVGPGLCPGGVGFEDRVWSDSGWARRKGCTVGRKPHVGRLVLVGGMAAVVGVRTRSCSNSLFQFACFFGRYIQCSLYIISLWLPVAQKEFAIPGHCGLFQLRVDFW